jgi:hypothetical protein
MDKTDKPYTVRFDEGPGVLRVSWRPGSTCTGPLAVALLEEVGALRLSQPVPVLVEMPKVGGMARDARQAFMNADHRFSKAALLTGSPVSTMVANFFISTRAMPMPIRSFTSEADALAWLTAAA